jgi:hypothetical protein
MDSTTSTQGSNLIPNAMDKLLDTAGSASVDFLIIGVLFVVMFAYSMYLGKGRAIVLLLSVYPAVLLHNYFPFAQEISKLLVKFNLSVHYGGVIIILVLTAVIAYFVDDTSPRDKTYGLVGRLAQSALLAILIIGLLLAVAYNLLQVNQLHDFSSQVDVLFSPTLFFWWLVAPFPIVYMIFRGDRLD